MANSPQLIDCDICHERKGRNRTVYHVLKYENLDSLKTHLKSVFGTGHYCIDFFTEMWISAHQLYGQKARDLYQPLWLVYLEAHGVKVANRGDVIMRHRGQLLIEVNEMD